MSFNLRLNNHRKEKQNTLHADYQFEQISHMIEVQN